MEGGERTGEDVQKRAGLELNPRLLTEDSSLSMQGKCLWVDV